MGGSHPKSVFPAKLAFKDKGKIKTFLDKQKCDQFYRTLLQKFLLIYFKKKEMTQKESLWWKKENEGKIPMNTYGYLNVAKWIRMAT